MPSNCRAKLAIAQLQKNYATIGKKAHDFVTGILCNKTLTFISQSEPLQPFP
ncbi:hypothetical protein GS601_20885 [Myxacorys almedinensis A]|uniref:Uncharacterized protein n=1 Tax=Myxacorys almedinensis A TaxID=2690445 RepID=A0A8J8CKC0_9CYAN|nr:hypothetical protein [Myxacorys almedinensis A]